MSDPVTYTVFMCAGSASTDAWVVYGNHGPEYNGFETGTCAEGQGGWVNVTSYEGVAPPWDHEIDWEMVGWASGATMLMWAVGLGIGLVIQIIRKTR